MNKFKRLSNPDELGRIVKILTGGSLKNTGNSKYMMFVRSCENIGSLSGCLNGWLDAKLSEYGRKQAKYLSVEFFSNFENYLNNDSDINSSGNISPHNYATHLSNNIVYTSDLLRAKETAEICMGYDFNISYKENSYLREIHFGDEEGLFYDGLSKEQKSRLNKLDNKFKNGEAWLDVKYRALSFINSVNINDNNNENKKIINNENSKIDLVFTHGGFITSLLYTKSLRSLPANGSIVIVKKRDDINMKDSVIKANSLLEDYKKNYYNSEMYDDSIYKKYNGMFDEFIDKSIGDIECVFDLPDITEELL